MFCEGNIYHYPHGLNLSRTWAPTAHFDNEDVEYAQIWAHGQTFSEMCPDHLKEEWGALNKKARAFLKSFETAKINLDDICFYDSVPRKFLIDFYSFRSQITDWVFEHEKKPKNYDFLKDLVVFLNKVKDQEVLLRMENLDFINPKVRNSFKKIKKSNNKIKYNPWSTVTGRLTTEGDSFPILTLNRELRNVVVPTNDLFVELDYNSAELRTFLGLLSAPQPDGDLHSWISENIFLSKLTRDETKKKVFAWLYNPKARNKKLNEKFNRDAILKKYYIDGAVNTPYNRKIKVDEQRALNYIIQSTASDLFLTSMLKVDKMLEDRKSFIAFCVHDSLIIDFAKEDQPLIEEVINVFSDTKFGKFKTNLSAGRNFGEMRKIK